MVVSRLQKNAAIEPPAARDANSSIRNNKFRILKERHVQMRKPYQSPGRMKFFSYYIAPVGDWTHDLPHTVASNMVKVSHSDTDLSAYIFLIFQSNL